MVGLLFPLSWSAKESPLVDQAHPPHPGQPLGFPVPPHPLLLSPYPIPPSLSSCSSSPHLCHSLKQESVVGSDCCTADSSPELAGDDGQLFFHYYYRCYRLYLHHFQCLLFLKLSKLSVGLVWNPPFDGLRNCV